MKLLALAVFMDAFATLLTLSLAAPVDASIVDKRYQLLRMGKRPKSDYSVMWTDDESAKKEVHSIDGVPLSSSNSAGNKHENDGHLEAAASSLAKNNNDDFDFFDDEGEEDGDVDKRGDKQVKLMRMGKRLAEKVRQHSNGGRFHGNYEDISKRIALMRMG